MYDSGTIVSTVASIKQNRTGTAGGIPQQHIPDARQIRTIDLNPSETDNNRFIDDTDVTILQAHTNCTGGGGLQRQLWGTPTIHCASIANLSTFLTMTTSKSNE